MDFSFRVDPRPFAAAVAWVARGLPTRPPVPVLAGMLLEVCDGELGVHGFDYETAHYATVGTSAATDGRAVVSGRLLAALVKDLPDALVQAEANGSALGIRCGRLRLTLPLMPVADYPALPILPPALGTVDAGEFAAAVERVWVASDHRDQRGIPELTGINLVAGEAVELWASDRYRAALAAVPWKPAGQASAEALVPANVLAEAAKTFDAGEVWLHLGDGLAGFRGEGRTVVTRLLAGEYPRLPGLFPTGHTTRAGVPVDALAVALRRAVQLGGATPAVLSFTPDGVTVDRRGDGGDASEDMPCVLDGPPLALALNPAYLLDALTTARSTTARSTTAHLHMTTARKPVVVTGDDDYRHLVVPVRLPT